MKKILLIIVAIIFCQTVYSQKRDTIVVMILYCDTTQSFAGDVVLWGKCYSVRELRNTSEGNIDPGMTPWAWQDYWQHLYFLDKDKKPLPKNIIVWQSKEISTPVK